MFPARAVAVTTGKAGGAAFGAATADLTPAIVGDKKYANRPSRSGTNSQSQRLRGGVVFLRRSLGIPPGVATSMPSVGAHPGPQESSPRSHGPYGSPHNYAHGYSPPPGAQRRLPCGRAGTTPPPRGFPEHDGVCGINAPGQGSVSLTVAQSPRSGQRNRVDRRLALRRQNGPRGAIGPR